MWKNSIKKFKLYFHWRMASIIWSTKFWDFGGKHHVYKFPCPKYSLCCSKDGKKNCWQHILNFFLPVYIWGWFSWRYFIQTLILALVITLFFGFRNTVNLLWSLLWNRWNDLFKTQRAIFARWEAQHNGFYFNDGS